MPASPAKPTATGTPRANPDDTAPPPAKPEGATHERARPTATLKGFARAFTPPTGTATTPAGLRPPAPSRGAPDRSRPRPPTDPEIETYLELEADLPPEAGDDPDLESELALSIALSGDFDAIRDSRPAPVEDGTRVIETTTDDGSELTLTVTESHEPGRQRAITADDGAAVSGTISSPEDGRPPRRARSRSEGRDD